MQWQGSENTPSGYAVKRKAFYRADKGFYTGGARKASPLKKLAMEWIKPYNHIINYDNGNLLNRSFKFLKGKGIFYVVWKLG